MGEQETGPRERRGEEAAHPARARGRLIVAFSALLIGVVAVVAISQGSGSMESADEPAPKACVQAWNVGEEELAYARHNRTFHDYEQARVVRDETLGDEPGGSCIVVFPSDVLDPEPEYAGQVLRGDDWRPLIEELESARVDELQGQALASPNVVLAEDGRLLATSDESSP